MGVERMSCCGALTRVYGDAGARKHNSWCRPYAVANSDNYKTQLLQTGRVVVTMEMHGRVDQYVDAIRTMAADLGLDHDDITMTLYFDQSILVTSLINNERQS